jgi:hypothetical protein
MTNPMSNIAFDMAAATLSNGKWQPPRCYFECAGSQVIEISLKPSWRLK